MNTGSFCGASRHLSTLIVVPAYNEEATVAGVIREIREMAPFADVAVVDDGSTDKTASVAKEAGAVVLTLPYNMGIGGAVRMGCLYAQRNAYDAVVQCDADGQHDPAYIEDLIDGLDHADVVIGSRFRGDSAYAAKGPRRWAMRLLSVSLSAMCGVRITDATSGFRALGRPGIALYARNLPAEYLADCLDGMILCHRAGLVISEVPVTMRERQAGEPSHGTISATLQLVRASTFMVIAATRRTPESVRQMKALKS